MNRMASPHDHSASEPRETDDDADVASIAGFLMLKYGPWLDSDALVEVLKFPNRSAFDRHRQRGLLSLKLVRVPKRSGVYALAQDTAKHLVQMARAEALRDMNFQDEQHCSRHSRER